MHVMGAFIGVHRLKVHHVTDHVEVLADAVAAMHVTGQTRNIQRLATIVALDQRHHLRRGFRLIHQAADAQRGLQAQGDLGLHIGQFQLEQLHLRQRLAELFAVQPILTGTVPAGLSRPHRAPGNAVTRAVQTAKRTFQTRDIRQQGVFAHFDIVHHDLAGDRRAQRLLAFDLRSRQPLGAFVQHKALDLAIMGVRFGPDHKHIRDRRVRDPHFRPVQNIAAVNLFGSGFHRTGIGPCIRFSQAKAADPLARRQFRQVFRALLFGAIGIDRIHHQRALHRHHRTVTTVDALHLARHQTIGHVTCANAAEFLRDGGAQQAHFTHLTEDLRVGLLARKRLGHTRHQLVFAIGAGRIADHTLIFGQLVFQQEGIVPVEGRQRRLGLGGKIFRHIFVSCSRLTRRFC
ncbi:hypothetical protein XMM3392_003260 [Aliiroseovarius sp. xm-m-339-2]|nr:hypothetical protein [Aliiroseovarius sp. xm-m-339-2]NRP63717.1 hypothetical protein [Aliiroseovarius sp. xm-a-151]